ncbi:MAG: hypothetical protein WC389_16180 [Lutibacter sp.]|jgi:hypothetical protein
MKTTTYNSVSKKLQKLTVKSEKNQYPLSKTSKAYQLAKDVIEGKKEIRPCHTSGRGRFCSNLDYTRQTEVILSKIGIDFESKNDSPRGGLTGNLIIIKTKITR